MHSHDIRNWEEFKDQRLLVIGASYSAEDTASISYKFGAKHVTISIRGDMLNYKWPA